MTQSNPLEITDGDGKLIHHENGDVTIVPDNVSDEDCAQLAKLDGSDIAEAIEARAAEAAQEAAAEEREKATADVLDHPESVKAADISAAGPGRTDTATVAAQVADSTTPGPDATPKTTVTEGGDQGDDTRTGAGPAFTG